MAYILVGLLKRVLVLSLSVSLLAVAAGLLFSHLS